MFIINLGSSCIYPLEAENPIKESSIMTGKLEPTNSPYAMAKLTAIEMGNSLSDQYGHKVLNLMPTNLYGPNDYFTKVRDPLPYAEMLQYALCFLLPLSNYILMFGYFMDPYKRDRSFYKMGVVITLLEMFLSYQVGYSMIFSLGSFLSILVTIGMEGYVQHSWSRKKYAKYRLEYRACHTLILFTIYMSVRPWVVKYYGITEGLPIVTTAFATISQRMFAQGLPLLVGCTQKPPTFKWFPLL